MSDSLKINIVTIPEEGLDFVLSENGEWFKRCVEGSDYPDFSLQKVDVNCRITIASNTVFIRGNLSVVLQVNCSRCLEDAQVSAVSDFIYTLVPAKSETEKERELNAEDLETCYYDGEFVDLTPLICEQIILQIPIKALCREECKGLCPQCGANLNTASCNCRREHVNDRMAVLKDFKIKKS
jgi:uncharacterized protein